MKYTFYLLLFAIIIDMMATSCKPGSPLQIREADEGLTIVFQKKERLKGLKGYSESAGLTNKLKVESRLSGNFVVVELNSEETLPEDPKAFTGAFFDEMPGFEKGVTLWRYKPWNSWTKPIRVEHPSEMQDWDIQFFYWKYDDGVYGAAMPLCGNGYRTTLGQFDGKFGAKSVDYISSNSSKEIPQMVIGFGTEPFALFRDLYKTGLEEMGKPENFISNKTFPEKLDYIGWCTWNSSENGKLLNEDFVVNGVKSFTEKDFPLGWVVIDDGWFDQTGRKLNSFEPNSEKFPDGFRSMNERLKKECDLKEIGIWHAFNGYWNGINPESELGKRYEDEMFSWKQKPSPVAPDSAELVTYHFIDPGSDSLFAFYDTWHRKLKEEGFSFLKVDNQLVVERMALHNYPIFSLSEKMHKALYQAADKYFDGTVINCMDMTAEAYLNFGNSAVARAVEDYFPAEHGGVGYEMEKGNAAAHSVMAFYNSLYFQQMVFPDFDMFESYNPHAQFHAVARAINNGPVYVTDKPGKQNFGILRSLCFSDGKLIRPSHALTPVEDCLFQLQEAKPFKAFSMADKTGLLGVWNLADADNVTGQVSPADIPGLPGDDFIVYEYFSKENWRISRDQKLDVQLPRMGCKLFYIIPSSVNGAAIGLADKYNAPGTIIKRKYSEGSIEVTLADHGEFRAVVPGKPKLVKLDEEEVDYTYGNSEVTVVIPSTKPRKNHDIIITW